VRLKFVRESVASYAGRAEEFRVPCLACGVGALCLLVLFLVLALVSFVMARHLPLDKRGNDRSRPTGAAPMPPSDLTRHGGPVALLMARSLKAYEESQEVTRRTADVLWAARRACASAVEVTAALDELAVRTREQVLRTWALLGRPG
jgi:hypothetical protein